MMIPEENESFKMMTKGYKMVKVNVQVENEKTGKKCFRESEKFDNLQC